jgi:hypothetical protein
MSISVVQVHGRRREVQVQATELEGEMVEWFEEKIAALVQRRGMLVGRLRGEAEKKDLAAQEAAVGRRKETLELLLSDADAKLQGGDLEMLRGIKRVKAGLQAREGEGVERPSWWSTPT